MFYNVSFIYVRKQREGVGTYGNLMHGDGQDAANSRIKYTYNIILYTHTHTHIIIFTHVYKYTCIGTRIHPWFMVCDPLVSSAVVTASRDGLRVCIYLYRYY